MRASSTVEPPIERPYAHPCVPRGSVANLHRARQHLAVIKERIRWTIATALRRTSSAVRNKAGMHGISLRPAFMKHRSAQ